VCSRSSKSEWIQVTDNTGQSKKLHKRLQKNVEQQEDMASEVEDQLKVLSYKKGRRKTSTNCGCTWAVNFAKPQPGQKNPLVRVTIHWYYYAEVADLSLKTVRSNFIKYNISRHYMHPTLHGVTTKAFCTVPQYKVV
jgi:hypothetical protein